MRIIDSSSKPEEETEERSTAESNCLFGTIWFVDLQALVSRKVNPGLCNDLAAMLVA